MNQEVIPPGGGVGGSFSRNLSKTKSLQCRGFTWALHMDRSISPLFPGPRGDVVANDKCIMWKKKKQ